MFLDFNVQRKTDLNWEPAALDIIERLVKFGYKGFAITTEVDESVFEKNKKNKEAKKKGGENTEPKIFVPPPPDLKNFKLKFPKYRFYNRINIVISESSNVRKFTQTSEIKNYDLISFQPETQNALKTLTGFAEVDIISYNPENKSDLIFNRKLYNQFVSHNVYFELIYAPAIADATARRNLISLSHVYKAIGKAKNIIVSSGAKVSAYIRGPHDVMNFNLLFGLNEEQSKNSISRSCEKLLLRARKRRFKTVFEIIPKELPEPTLMEIDSSEEKKAICESDKNLLKT